MVKVACYDFLFNARPTTISTNLDLYCEKSSLKDWAPEKTWRNFSNQSIQPKPMKKQVTPHEPQTN
jgi:hypothetical protein